ncbi:DUF998 domain-containing protein [Streptomyces longispororuber]|uniref:DUF998 domain-containing protein n=1 Tax=Streptomyces longispororuber TaxID=68230 RepID=UPI0036F74E7C
MTETTTHSRPERRAREPLRTAAALLAAAALVYNAWVLEAVVPTGLAPRHAYVSELYAVGSPYRWLFGGLELVCAALIVTGAVAGGAAATDRVGRAGWWALAGVGLCSTADVLMPMACAPSVQPGCRAVHPAHTVTSALVHCCLFACMTLLVYAARRRGEPRSVARWGPLVGAGALVSSLCTVGPLLGYGGWHGVAQRCHLLLVGAWLALLAHGARTPYPPPGAPAPPSTARRAARGLFRGARDVHKVHDVHDVHDIRDGRQTG